MNRSLTGMLGFLLIASVSIAQAQSGILNGSIEKQQSQKQEQAHQSGKSLGAYNQSEEVALTLNEYVSIKVRLFWSARPQPRAIQPLASTIQKQC